MDKPRGVEVVAETVHPDEPCWGLAEMTLTSSDHKSRKRYQLVYVSRHDRIVPYVQDVTEDVKGDLDVPPLRIISMGTDSVGQLWSLADDYRFNHELEQRLLERAGTSTLIKDVLEVSQEIKKIQSNSSLFGYGKTGATRQRTGFRGN